ncbi:MoaD/ThiS family protein [Acidaminobacter hydrogenoformans]|uniref:Molybdopterin converting factor, small subunit n=1 Tax=Acidaminobacter hydrogenoformans DSM 2784 TaxID=1120920 RepID=A0A1G5RZB8_9FIRM|nr:MoaD/ThiS family protein [Acidaminobacter hydrogenoformans]SCZ78801.1 Molybdopterin converting factor, small subunit [Acidaminobacter hydrogenoformans DSM 2784]
MKIKVKLFATLRENREKEMLLHLNESATPSDILSLLNILHEEAAIIMVNGRHAKPDALLVENDTVALFPPVGGG